MTLQERIRIFRPLSRFAHLDMTERSFVKKALKLSLKQAESIRLQFENGTKADNLILDAKIIADMAKALSALLVDTFGFGVLGAKHEIQQAKIKYDVKFAAMKEGDLLDMPFYPEAGIDWYNNYALKLAGVEQQALLEKCKQAISDGVIEGLSHKDVMAQIGDIFGYMSKGRLENIARTETSKIYEQARWNEFDNTEEIIGYQISAIIDTRTTDICRHRNGKIILKKDIEGWLPPYHYQCRTQLLPVFDFEDVSDSEFWNADGDKVKPFSGFGSTSMEIPDVTDKPTIKIITRAEKKLPKVDVKPVEVAKADLSGAFKGLPEDKRQVIIESMKDAPENLKKIVVKYSNDVGYINTKRECYNYTHTSNANGAVQVNYNNNKIKDMVIVHHHEFGHFIDHIIHKDKSGLTTVINDGESFVTLKSALDIDAKLLKDKIVKQSIYDLLKDNKYRIRENQAVSDSFCAIYKTYIEGTVGHRDNYWRRRKNSREIEVFANMFETYSRNKTESILMFEKYFPETVKAFWQIIDEALL